MEISQPQNELFRVLLLYSYLVSLLGSSILSKQFGTMSVNRQYELNVPNIMLQKKGMLTY